MAGSPKAATRLDARGVPIVFPSNNTSAAPPPITASNNSNNGKRSRTHSRQTSMNSPCNSPSKRRIRTPSRQLTMENEADEIQLYKSRALSTTPKQDRSLLDEYDAYSDAYHKSYINHINKMFGPASQVHSSPNSLQDASTEPIPLSAKNSPISSPHIYNNNNNNNNNSNSNSNMRNSLHFIMNDTNMNNNNNNTSGNFNNYNNNNSISNYSHTTTIQCPPNKVSPFPSSPHKRLEAVRQYRQKHPYISPTRPTIRNDRFNPDHLMANDIFRMDENSLSERFRKNPLNFTFQFNDTQEENSSFGTIIKPIPSDNFSTVNISSSQNQSQNQSQYQNENQNENNNHNHNNHITPMLNSIEHATHTPLIIDPYHHTNSKSGTLLKENEINNNNHDDMNNCNLANDKNEINIDLDNNSDLYIDQQKSISIVIPEPNTESQNLGDDHDHKDNTDTMNNMKQTEEQNMNENRITGDHNISLPNDLKNKSSSTHSNNDNNNNNSNNETNDNNNENENENENENNNKIDNDNDDGQEVGEVKTNINNDKENDNMNEKQFTPIEPTPSEQINVNTNNNTTVTNTTNITKPLEESQQNANQQQQQKEKKLNVDENHHRHDKNENVDKETEKEEKLQTEKMEREMIQNEIDHLNRSVKHLSTHYKLIERIGYGTFGTVYKAKDLQNSIGQYYQKLKSTQTKTSSLSSSSSQTSSQSSPSQPFCSSLAMLSPLSLNQEEISNSTTCDHSPPSSSSSSNDKTEFVALKHIYSLSSPQRMGHEIKVLHELRGASCVAPLISAFRQDDNIFMVMPYFEHDDFRDCYRNMSMLDIKHYFISLLTALKNIHKKSIIHRDVKPNNFLYNMKLKTGMLIDFGLAQKEASDLPKSVRSTYHSLVKENTLKSFKPFESTSVFSEFLNGIKPTKPGYFRNDYREHAKGNRGGTRGFRAPEVLLRVKHQTVSIDIWSVGVILLSVLTGRYPFFVAQDEGDSLLEFANIFGLKEMKECAALYNRTFDTNIETLPKTRISLRKLCQVLNTEKFKLWTKENKEDILNALNLLEKLLTLDYTERITAEEALMHPFLIL